MRFIAITAFLVLSFLTSCTSTSPSSIGSTIDWGQNRLLAGTKKIGVELNMSGDVAAEEPVLIKDSTVHAYFRNEVGTDPDEGIANGYNQLGIELVDYPNMEWSLFHRAQFMRGEGRDSDFYGGVRLTKLIETETCQMEWLDIAAGAEGMYVNTRLVFDLGDSLLEPTFDLGQNWNNGTTPVVAEVNWIMPNWLGHDKIRPFIGAEVRFHDIGESLSNHDTSLNFGIAASF